MKLYRTPKKHHIWRQAAALLLFVLIAAGVWFSAAQMSQQESSGQIERLQSAVRRAAVSCYAVEGCYPPDVAYLEEHYGVQIDHEHYSVWYECIGSNIMPTVEVAPVVQVKTGGGE